MFDVSVEVWRDSNFTSTRTKLLTDNQTLLLRCTQVYVMHKSAAAGNFKFVALNLAGCNSDALMALNLGWLQLRCPHGRAPPNLYFFVLAPLTPQLDAPLQAWKNKTGCTAGPCYPPGR